MENKLIVMDPEMMLAALLLTACGLAREREPVVIRTFGSEEPCKGGENEEILDYLVCGRFGQLQQVP